MNRYNLAQSLALVAGVFVVGTVVSRVRGRSMADALRHNVIAAGLFAFAAVAMYSIAGLAR
jgi:hypothetical protein